MSRRARALAAIALLLLGAGAGGGCTSRDHSNPFDPDNPETGGEPALLDAIAGDQRVTLRWEIGNLEGIRALEIVRRDSTGTVQTLQPDSLDPQSGSFVDHSAQNGTEYAYSLQLWLEGGGSQETEWDPATPGTTIAWIADADGGGLVRVSPDGRDIVQRRLGGSWMLDVVADPSSLTVWSADYLLGSVRQHSWDGDLLRESEAPGARAIALPPEASGYYVSLFPSAALQRRALDGRVIWADSLAGHIEDLLAAPMRAAELTWSVTAEGQANLYLDGAKTVTIEDLTRPVALALANDGTVLLLDRGAGTVHRYEPSGAPLGASVTDLVDPVDLCPDASTGVWVADPGRAEIVHLDGDLEEIGAIEVPGVLALTWDEEQQRLWAVGLSGLRVFDRDGNLTASLSLGPRPVAIALLHDAE